jgi:hypothetical protein
MTTERSQPAGTFTGEHFDRAAQLANVILDQTRFKGFSAADLYISLKMVHLRLERDLHLTVSRWDENSIEWYLSRSYLPR